jgi:hypothetical protein
MTTIDHGEPPPRGEKQAAIITDIMVERRPASPARPMPRSFHTRAFSSEVDTGCVKKTRQIKKI